MEQEQNTPARKVFWVPPPLEACLDLAHEYFKRVAEETGDPKYLKFDYQHGLAHFLFTVAKIEAKNRNRAAGWDKDID